MRTWLALLAALLLAGCGEGAALDRLAGQGRGRVIEVRAGDVVGLDDGRVVKLAGVAAPRRDEPHAAASRRMLEALTLGREVELLSGGANEDAFGRRLAHLRLVEGRVWVQGRLLEAGAARVRTYADNRALATAMLEREAKARARRAGLWALPTYDVLTAAEAARADGFVIVEGRVRRVLNESGETTLDLGGIDGRVPRQALADFAAADRAPARLAGRLVRVRGVLRRDGVLRLDHPEAVEPLSEP